MNMDGEDVSFGCIPQENVSTRRKNPIIHLPTEVLVVLLKNLSYRDLGAALTRLCGIFYYVRFQQKMSDVLIGDLRQ